MAPAGRRVWRRCTLHTLRMARNEYRDEQDEDAGAAPDTYWRRRAITLALGLGLLGILAWGFSGGGSKSQASNTSLLPATALGTAVPGVPGTASPSAGSSGTPGPGKGISLNSVPSASGSATSSATASASASPSAAARSTAGPKPATATPSAAPGSGASCPPGSVVLSMFADRYSYAAGQYPRFNVYAVSTSPGTCGYSPGQLQVVVMSSNRIVWDSSDCARGNGGRPAELTRGIPVQDEVTWNRAITLPGCQVLAPAARPGYYQVQVRAAATQSPVRNFRLTG